MLRPVEWIPDRLSPYVPPLLRRERCGARPESLGFDEPVLWVNNHSLARFALGTGWPVVYDITDDWLLADLPAGKRRRAEIDDRALDARRGCGRRVLAGAGRVSRALDRDVVVIPNGVDLAHFTTPQPRPEDLGEGPVAVYVGTLHDERLDVQLCCDIADELADVRFVYVGPDSLRAASHVTRSRAAPNVRLLGPRPYAVVPAYLQHADAVFVPHVVSPVHRESGPDQGA